MLSPIGMDSLGMHDWQTADIEVRIKETHDDSGLIGQTGIIRGVSVRNTLSLYSYVADGFFFFFWSCNTCHPQLRTMWFSSFNAI